MKIIYDHQIFGWQKHGGISRYFHEVSRRIAARAEHDVEIVAPFHVNEYLGSDTCGKLAGLKVPKVVGSNLARRIVNAGVSRLLLRQRRDVNIFHETYYSTVDACPGSARRILTVFDMIHERFPEHFPARDATSRLKQIAVHRADHVICISESTRNDLVSICGVAPEKTTVVHLGHDLATEADSAAFSRYAAQRFILYVGMRDGYKNFKRLVQAYAASPLLRKEFSLICFGGGAFSGSERSMFASLGLDEDQLLQVSGSDSILVSLYSCAAVLVYPSLYEGFGLPPLEAMSRSCPVICANSSSLPEVVGDAAELFDPASQEELRKAIERIVLSPAHSKVLTARGLEHVRKFSWDRCADQTQAVYHRVLGG